MLYPDSNRILSFPVGSWCVKLSKTKLSSPARGIYLFVFLCLCGKVSSSQVPRGFTVSFLASFPSHATNSSFDTTPTVQTWATELKSQLGEFGFLVHVVFFKNVWFWSCLGLSLTHIGNILIFIFLPVSLLCFISVMPGSKALTLFMVQIQIFPIDTDILFEMAWGLSIGCVRGNIFI